MYEDNYKDDRHGNYGPVGRLVLIGPVGGIVTMDVPYMVNGRNLVGYMAYDSSISGPRPGVLVVHE
ncbi:MAG: hypothetical protein RQ801_13360 [Spirochaetaceae bacterium]|nr:hypothetical protein [Spirochaetaceae bacterium]